MLCYAMLRYATQDNQKDADGNGVADVNELDPQQLATRKTLLFLKSVDPQRMTAALAGIYTTHKN